jgi:hypothetical protein
VFWCAPQKIKIDIDFANSNIGDGMLLNPEMILYDIIGAAHKIFMLLYYDQICKIAAKAAVDDADSDLSDIERYVRVVVTKTIAASTSDGAKIGYHVIFPDFFVKNNTEGAVFTNMLYKILCNRYGKDSHHASCIDTQVNKRIQSFRLIGCCKPGQPDRIKSLFDIGGGSSDPIQTLITIGAKHTLAPSWLRTPHNPTGVRIDIQSNELSAVVSQGGYGAQPQVRKIEDACLQKMTREEKDSFVMRTCQSSFVTFRRTKSSFCSICMRVHESDNTLYFVIMKHRPLTIYKKCFHKNDTCSMCATGKKLRVMRCLKCTNKLIICDGCSTKCIRCMRC